MTHHAPSRQLLELVLRRRAEGRGIDTFMAQWFEVSPAQRIQLHWLTPYFHIGVDAMYPTSSKTGERREIGGHRDHANENGGARSRNDMACDNRLFARGRPAWCVMRMR